MGQHSGETPLGPSRNSLLHSKAPNAGTRQDTNPPRAMVPCKYFNSFRAEKPSFKWKRRWGEGTWHRVIENSLPCQAGLMGSALQKSGSCESLKCQSGTKQDADPGPRGVKWRLQGSSEPKRIICRHRMSFTIAYLSLKLIRTAFWQKLIFNWKSYICEPVFLSKAGKWWKMSLFAESFKSSE